MLLRLSCFLLLFGCATDLNRDDPAPTDLAERFAVLAFRAESGEIRTLTRWEGPVAIYTQGPYFRYVDRAVQQVRTATGVPIEYVRDFEDANVAVFVASDSEIRQLVRSLPAEASGLRRFTCAGVAVSDEGSLAASIVMIHDGLEPDHIRRCAVQEIAQVMGLLNDIADPDGTVFSSHSTRDSLSETDKLMLQTLYDPRLRPGMTRDEAMPIIRDILSGV